MNIELLKEGFLIMIIGMGFVYFFIFIMIIFVDMVSKLMKILNKYFPEEIEEEKYQTKKKTDSNDAEIAIAICCALAEGRKAC